MRKRGEMPKEPDITLARNRGNRASADAFRKTQHSSAEMRERILGVLSIREMSGKAIAAMFGVPFNAVSGRFSELKRDGLIEGTGVRRDGSEILRSISRQRRLF